MIAVCEYVFAGRPLRELAPFLAEWGYDGVELAGEPARADRPGIAETLAAAGLRAVGTTASCDWPTDERDLASPDAEVRRRAVAFFQACVDLAADAGAPQINVLAGACGRLAPVTSVAEEWQHAVEAVREVAEYAGERDVVVGVEALNRYEGFLVTRIEDALAFADEVGLPNVGVVADTFHMAMEERDPVAALAQAAPRLRAVHLADSNRQGLGRGTLRLEPLLAAARAGGFTGPYVFEFNAPGPDPFAADKGPGTAEIVDAYARESAPALRAALTATPGTSP